MRFEEYEEIILRTEQIIQTFNNVVNHNGTALFKQEEIFRQMNENLILNTIQFFSAINFMHCTMQPFSLQSKHMLSYSHITKRWTTSCNNPAIKPYNQIIIDKLDPLIKFILKGDNLQLYKMQLADLPQTYHHLFLWCQKTNDYTIKCHVTDIRFVHQNQHLKNAMLFHISKEEILNIEKVSKKFSKYHINQAYKFYFNCSTFVYLQYRQMIKAYELALTTNLTMKEIAALAGYNSYTTMNRTFKRFNFPLKKLPRLIA